MPVPEELIFTVDERVRRDIALAKEQYYKSVSNTRTHGYIISESLLCNPIMQYHVVFSFNLKASVSTVPGPAGCLLRLHLLWESSH